MFSLPGHLERQVTGYAERHSITSDEAAKRLPSQGLTAIGAWRFTHGTGAFPYEVQRTVIEYDADGEPIMQLDWMLVEAVASLLEARQLLTETTAAEQGALPLRLPVMAGCHAWRIVKSS